METENIALIPSYKPDSRLISTAKELLSSGFNRVVVVNDGSGAGYQDIFSAAQKLDGVCVVTHTVNMGKGRALKTGFNFILERFPGCCAVAVDGDGQHRVCDAMSAAKYADLHPDALILGCRNFSKTENIPLANYLGNVLTRITVWLLTGLWFSDTQCGLRAYPPDIMRALCDVPGDRFEFENNTLLNIRTGGMKCVEFPITVNYEKKDKYVTTFRRAADSARIYGAFLKYALAPLLALLFSSVAMLLLQDSSRGPVYNAVAAALSLFPGFAVSSLTVKRKLPHFFSGLLISALYGVCAYFLFGAGFSVPSVYLLLLFPLIVFGYLAFRSVGLGRAPRIIRYQRGVPD
jgi:glycosyltransferase involved in cell wall biosynthesis